MLPRSIVILALLALPGALGGCKSDQPPASQPASEEHAEPAALTLIPPAALKWTAAAAVANLPDEKLGLAAAVRLVQLSEVQPLCVPVTLTDKAVARLRLVRLRDSLWALGLGHREDERRLHAPVLINELGKILQPATETAEELLVLYVSEDSQVFPHLLISPRRIEIVEDEIVSAVVLQTDEPVRFDLRRERGYPYIALVFLSGNPPPEVARYTWEPYELVFLGPAVDTLPDPPGGKFRVDLQASLRLEPVGGELPEPEENPEPPVDPERRPPPEDWPV